MSITILNIKKFILILLIFFLYPTNILLANDQIIKVYYSLGHVLIYDNEYLAKKENEKANHQMEAQKPLITFDDFSHNDMRVGTIIAAERVPKTKNLLKMTIDTGIDQRTVVSGIAAYYEPENIIGQQVTILVNLAPRDIKGITSEGMILMAENADGSLAFIAPTKAISNGGSVK